MIVHVENSNAVDEKLPGGSIERQILSILDDGPLDCSTIARVIDQNNQLVFRRLKSLIDADTIAKFPLHAKIRRKGRPKMLYAKKNWK
ncbi:MAG TPA: hypothetical protein VKM55_18030 [Candidatus Lokiarchaeia archaeon]|nr:hypothetical protein [Candidatus Lokiarchaeia archaeon]